MGPQYPATRGQHKAGPVWRLKLPLSLDPGPKRSGNTPGKSVPEQATEKQLRAWTTRRVCARPSRGGGQDVHQRVLQAQGSVPFWV